MPVVSVVVPTYNRADLLPRAIDSALNQTVEDIEVIVVDDASTDDTPAVMGAYDESRVLFVRHDENRGGAAARNTGIEHAIGDYIAFLDSDDEWLPEKLERQIEELEGRSNEWVAAYCDIVSDRDGLQKHLYDGVSTVWPSFSKSSATDGDDRLIKDIHANRFHLGGASTLLVERSAVEAVDGFDPSFPRHQDLEFLVRLLKVGKLVYVPEELVVRHSTGMPDLSVVAAAKEKYFEKFQDDISELEAAGVPVAAFHNFSLARYHFQCANFGRGLRYLVRSRAPNSGDYLRLCWSGLAGLKNLLSG